MCDFSNAARKAFTSIKKAELLGGMGSVKKVISKSEPDVPDFMKDIYAKIVKDRRRFKKDNAKSELLRANTPQKKKEVIESLKRNNAFLNQEINENLPKKNYSFEKVGYVDAIQKARYGKTKPIKSENVISRSGLLQNPQDNTVLSAAQEKVVNATRKDKLQREYGVTLIKNNPQSKLKTSDLIKGDSKTLAVNYTPEIQKTYDAKSKTVGTIHSHPSQKGGQFIPDLKSRLKNEAWNVKPSPNDFNVAAAINNNLKGDDKGINIITSLNQPYYYPNTGRNRITKKTTKNSALRTNTIYNSDNFLDESNRYKTRRDLRKVSRGKADYTVTTSNKSQ